MFAAGPVALSALCLLRASTQIEAGARVEARVGDVPVPPDGTSQNWTSQSLFVTAVTPALALSLRTSDHEVKAGYAPRFLWTVPTPDDSIHPLILQTLLLSDVYQPSKRSQWRTNLQAVYGEEDSIALAQLLPGQATLPSAMRIFSVTAATNASWRSSRLTTLSFQIAALHRRPIDDQTAATPTNANAFPLSTQTTLGATPALLRTLSRRSRMEFSIPVSYSDSLTNNVSSATIHVLLFQPQVGWIDELSRRHQFRLTAGVSYADITTGNQTTYPAYPITPIVRTGLNSLLGRSRSLVLRSALAAEVSWYLDPVLGAAVPRALLAARIDATMGPHWSAGAFVNFTTDATPSPPAANPNDPRLARNGGYPSETLLAAGIPVRYNWSNFLFVEFAGRFAARAPHLRVPDRYFRWGETEVWATVTLSAASRFPLGPS